jgi:hypothetical protein
MNSHELQDEGEADLSEVPSTMTAALVYEDLTTGMRARYVLESAALLLPGAPHFSIGMWRFDVLRMVRMREIALKAASVAVIVLLSGHGSRALPRAVMVWVNRWLECKSDQPCALVVSLDEKSRESASAAQMIFWLRAEAKAKDVAVFPRFGATPFLEGDPAIETAHRLSQMRAATLENPKRWPDFHSEWGINE